MATELNLGHFQTLMGQAKLLIQPPMPHMVRCYAAGRDLALIHTDAVFGKGQTYLGLMLPHRINRQITHFEIPFAFRIPRKVVYGGSEIDLPFGMIGDDATWYSAHKVGERDGEGSRRLLFFNDGIIDESANLFMDARIFHPITLLRGYPSGYHKRFGCERHQLLVHADTGGGAPLRQIQLIQQLASAFVFILPGDEPNKPYERVDAADGEAEIRMSALRKAVDLMVSAIQIGRTDPTALIEDIEHTAEHLEQFPPVAENDPNLFRWAYLASTLRVIAERLKKID